MKKTLTAIGVAVVVAVAIGWANYSYARTTNSDFRTFRSSICAVVAQQGQQGRSFQSLLVTLEQRAVARERLDKQAGDLNAAAADADSARLYETVIAESRPHGPHATIDC